MVKKRFALKLFILLLFLSLSVITVIVSSKIIFKRMQNGQKMITNYETKKEKCELLKDIAKETIQEGVCIDTRKISNNEVRYRIYNDNERILFYYYLQDGSTTDNSYNAVITLSNEYKILDEKYSVEIESFEEYVKSCKVSSILCGIEVLLLIYLLLTVAIALLTSITKKEKGKKVRDII